jgi:hypothetical protein
MSWTYLVAKDFIKVDRKGAEEGEHPWVLIKPQHVTVWLGRTPKIRVMTGIYGTRVDVVWDIEEMQA